MMTNTTKEDELRTLDGLAMNIVHQIGDVLYDALPKDVAHQYFVTARQSTNDTAIDFAMKLIKQYGNQQRVASIQLYMDTCDQNSVDPSWESLHAFQDGQLTALKEQEKE